MTIHHEPGDPHVHVADVSGIGNALLLDVREDDEWHAGHAPEAVHAPLSALRPDHPALARGRTIVCVCRSGNRSQRATHALNTWGFDAVNMVGGMQAWWAAGLPVVDDDGDPGAVV